MLKLKTLIFVISFLVCAFAQAKIQIAPDISISERAIVVAINMTNGKNPKKLKTKIYNNEQQAVLQLIGEKVEPNYGRVLIIYKEEATEENFLAAIEELANDSNIKVIDTIIYMHGHSANSDDGIDEPALGFFNKDQIYTKTRELSEKVKSISQNKLRVLYSDACWSMFHNDDWLNAGYLAVAGSKAVDANRAIDLRRFLDKWNLGRSFGRSIDFANKNLISKIMDLIIGGDSKKIPIGALHLTINSGFEITSIDQQEYSQIVTEESVYTNMLELVGMGIRSKMRMELK